MGQSIPKEAPHYMLQQTSGLLLHQLADHVAEHGADSVKALVRGTDVVEPVVVQQDLLHDEDGNGLGQLGACLHDAQAEGNDLGGQEEVDDLGRIVLDESTDDTQTRKPEVLEWARLGGRVEEGIEIQRDVGCATLARSLSGGNSTRHVPFRNRVRVSLWEATHCSSASALQTLLEAAAVSCEGLSRV